MRRLGTVSALSILGVLAALLTGCPVWGPDTSPPPADSGPRTCDRDDQCAPNQYCNTSTHECVVTTPCGAGAQCPAGYYCDGRNACVPGCSSDNDCTVLGRDLVCNTSTNRCEPSGQCRQDSDCPTAGDACVAGSCRPADTLCRFNHQCGAGQECVDGRCLAQCRPGADAGAGSCPSGQVCTDGYCQYPSSGTCNCAPGQVCAGGVCLSACTDDMQCADGSFCDHGVCRIDDRRPPPFCTPPSNGCATGSVCVDGVCRISCPTGTADECMRRDVNFNQCDAQRVCRYSNEANPQCQRNSDCGADLRCVNAVCR
jgi:hypothetical protein